MKLKHIFSIVIGILFLIIGKPVFHLLKTKWNENKNGITNKNSYKLNQSTIDSLIYIDSNYENSISQLKKLMRLAYNENKTISIAGGRYSMGGHTIYPNGIVLDMTAFNSIQVDTINNIASIGAGARWHEVIDTLNKYNRSLKIMQAFSSFSVGGSISVNGHGWQKNTPPLSSSVISLLVMKADGEIIRCSMHENKELFRLIIGGYGLFGIILEAKLEIVANSFLKYNNKTFPSEQYLDHFNRFVKENKNVELVYGRLDITEENFLNTAHLNYFTKTDERPNSTYKAIPLELKRIIFRGTVNNSYGKKLRNQLEKLTAYIGDGQIFHRNDLLNESVELIENRDSSSVDILQEYFIPDQNINKFINALKKVLPHQRIDLLNITIRDVDRDTISYMNYAREHVFGFVFLFNQPNTILGENEMKKLTQLLTSIALDNKGTYYLPYRLHNSKELFHESYPQAVDFFQKKTTYDPHKIFKNMFYDYYK